MTDGRLTRPRAMASNLLLAAREEPAALVDALAEPRKVPEHLVEQCARR